MVQERLRLFIKMVIFQLQQKKLFMSQPAVSQQISMLEAHVGNKLFNGKSKGVEPTEYAKLLNNLIIDALDRLESVEAGFKIESRRCKSINFRWYFKASF